MLVRTWNVFHGNTVPTRREARLEEMVRRASADGPGVLCLQELPVWSLGRLDDWSGMLAVGEVARPPRLGPFPSTAEIGRVLTDLNHGLLRSAFTGQAIAILLAPDMRVLERTSIVLNPLSFRRAQARTLALPRRARLAWARERRVCQAVRVALPDGRTMTVANIHATPYVPDQRVTDAELLRAAVFVDTFARPGEVCVFAGDFNVSAGRSTTLQELRSWGFSPAMRSLDHILVRGARRKSVAYWPDDRRRVDGLLLSDHAPLEVVIDV